LVKIAIKIGVLVVVLVVMYLGYNLFVKKSMQEKIAEVNGNIAYNQTIDAGLGMMMSHQPIWNDIFAAQRRDMEYVRSVLPEAPFNEKTYLLRLLEVFHNSNVYSKGVSIRPVQKTAAQAQYMQFFSLDLGGLAGSIGQFNDAFNFLKEEVNMGDKKMRRVDTLVLSADHTQEDLEMSLWHSFLFNQKMAIRPPEGVNLLAGLEVHRFDTTVSGSYDDIKNFIWRVQNMRPHTVIVNWHLSPGAGNGAARAYNATLSLITFVDTNIPPSFQVPPDDKYKAAYDVYPDMPYVTPLVEMAGIMPK
jgi:hypothetical protein